MPGVTVVTFPGSPREAITVVSAYDGSGNLEYSGSAECPQPLQTIAVTSISAAGAGVVTTDADHGLASDNIVTISGATGDWDGVNGDHIITVTGTDTFTIPVNTSAFTGDFDGILTTRAPQTTRPIWSIQRLYYTGTNLTRVAWADGNTSSDNIWDDRASLGYQ